MDDKCPKCGSSKIVCVSTTYPRSYECKDCGHVFVSSPQALVDENL